MPPDPLGKNQGLVPPELYTLMATMVHEGLFVGPGSDCYKFAGSILHCARDPWYVAAQTRLLCPQQFSDYGIVIEGNGPLPLNGLWARMGYNELALNMVDAADPRYFCDEMVNAGLDFITERMAEGDAVLVHCNLGISRSPSMAFLWMFEHGFLDFNFGRAVTQFQMLYSDWSPGTGIWQYLKRRCEQ